MLEDSVTVQRLQGKTRFPSGNEFIHIRESIKRICQLKCLDKELRTNIKFEFENTFVEVTTGWNSDLSQD